jgi:hypothetical protein
MGKHDKKKDPRLHSIADNIIAGLVSGLVLLLVDKYLL